jgi:mevalonate kinase
MKRFFSKILLFGEYSVLTGSHALITPFRRFYGELAFEPEAGRRRSNVQIRKLFEYLSGQLKPGELPIYLDQFEQDIGKGIFFKTSIREKYGLGSSAALVAAICSRYGKTGFESMDILKMKEELARVESYFHGKSSGIDPLCIFLGKPLHIKPGHIEVIDDRQWREILSKFYLFDTGTASPTKEFIDHYLVRQASIDFLIEYKKYELAVNEAIFYMIRNDGNSLAEKIGNISVFQLKHFKPMIPAHIIKYWVGGINTSNYFFKLCGSGGGGYMLVFSMKPKAQLERLLQSRLIQLVVPQTK